MHRTQPICSDKTPEKDPWIQRREAEVEVRKQRSERAETDRRTLAA